VNSTNESGREACTTTEFGAMKAQRGGAIRHIKENGMAANQTIINPEKELIINESNKGGVGKTTLSKLLAELLRLGIVSLGVKPADDVLLLDGDTAVEGLADVFAHVDDEGEFNAAKNKAAWRTGCSMLDFRNADQLERVAGQLRTGARKVLADCPGGVTDLSSIFGDIDGFKTEAKRLGFTKIKVNFVIGYDKASARGAVAAAKQWGDGVEFTVIKNLGLAKKDEFLFFDGEITDRRRKKAAKSGKGLSPKAEIEAMGGKVVCMPALDPASIQVLSAFGTTIQDAIAEIIAIRDEPDADETITVRLGKLEKFLHKDCIPMFFELGLLVDVEAPAIGA
jgi:hypothetical protein